MKLSINSINSIEKAKESNSLYVSLEGDEKNLSLRLTIGLDGRDPYTLTLKDIEDMAITQAKNDFSSC